jgi:hypothetical protein
MYLLYGAVLLLTLPLRLLPDVTLPIGLSNSIVTANGYLSAFNAFLPIGTALQVFSAILIIEAGVITYKLIMWILTKIPGISN